jgi:hypothetical protein
MSRDRVPDEEGRRGADGTPDAPDPGRFVRGLTIGLIVGAVIAGSTLWRHLRAFQGRP